MSKVLNFDSERMKLCAKQLAGEREQQLRTLYPSASSGVVIPMSKIIAEGDLTPIDMRRKRFLDNIFSAVPDHGRGEF